MVKLVRPIDCHQNIQRIPNFHLVVKQFVVTEFEFSYTYDCLKQEKIKEDPPTPHRFKTSFTIATALFFCISINI